MTIWKLEDGGRDGGPRSHDSSIIACHLLPWKPSLGVSAHDTRCGGGLLLLQNHYPIPQRLYQTIVPSFYTIISIFQYHLTQIKIIYNTVLSLLVFTTEFKWKAWSPIRKQSLGKVLRLAPPHILIAYKYNIFKYIYMHTHKYNSAYVAA